MSYVIRGLHKFTEVDDWDKGCIGPAHASQVDVDFTGDTVDEVIAKVASFLDVATEGQDNAVERDACDELGRVDFAKTENDDGEELGKAGTERWKQGKQRAWYAVYTGYVESLQRVTARSTQP